MPAKKSAIKKHSDRFFGVDILKSSHPEIKKIKREHPTSIHGNKFWGSSYLLMDYFKKNPLSSKDRVLELGCGWGLASIYLNKKYGCSVTGVDADDDVFPYLELHAEINKADVSTVEKRFEQLTKKYLSQYDVIIAADVCFWDELTGIHKKLIKRAVNAGVKKIVYADPERSPFLALAEHCTEKYCADIITREMEKPVAARGALMVIENA
jgi:predicted nicotinamide N-methyase